MKKAMNWRDSIRLRLVLLLIALALLPMAAVTAIALTQVTATMQAQTTDQLDRAAGTAQRSLATWLTDRKRDVTTIADLTPVRAMNPAQTGPAVEQYFKAWGLFETLLVAKPDGTLLYNSDKAIIPTIADRAYFQQALAGKPNISDALVSKGSGNMIVMIAIPVLSDGKVVGVACGSVRLADIAALLKDLELGATGDAYLVNKDGLMISPPAFRGGTQGGRTLQNTPGTGSESDHRSRPASDYWTERRLGLLEHSEPTSTGRLPPRTGRRAHLGADRRAKLR